MRQQLSVWIATVVVLCILVLPSSGLGDLLSGLPTPVLAAGPATHTPTATALVPLSPRPTSTPSPSTATPTGVAAPPTQDDVLCHTIGPHPTAQTAFCAQPRRAAPRAGSLSRLLGPLAPSGTVWAFGDNFYGELGNGSTTNSSVPVQTLTLTNVVTVATGGDQSLALRTDGTVVAWGLNQDAELGDGTTTNRTSPVQVSNLTGVVAIAAGGYHSLALKSDGTVWAWGLNDYGELGAPSGDTCPIGSTTELCSKTPIQVSGLTGVTAIAAGGFHSLALKSDGTVWSWGLDNYGQLGLTVSGTCTVGGFVYSCSTTPVQVTTLSVVTSLSGGWQHSLALKSDGTVLAFGYNAFGQLGNGTTTRSTTPVQVSNLSGVKALAQGAGPSTSQVLKSDGTVWDWGWGLAGNLGNGQTQNSSVPIQVSGLSGVTAVAIGAEHGLAVVAGGNVYAWGDNSKGELGNGSTTNSSTPVQVSTLSGISVVAGGAAYSVATAATTALPVQAAPAGTDSNPPLINTTTSRDPVNTLTGSYAYSHTDLAIAGRGPSPTFVRSYNSDDSRTGPLGPGWTHNYNAHLASPGDGTSDVILDGPQGRSDRYTLAGGVFTPPPAVFTTLVKNGDGTYTATFLDQTVWTFTSTGQLSKISDRYGNASALTYNGSGQLVSVSDPAGRGSLTFSYTNNLLTSVTDWASPARSVQYGYDAQGRLQTVTDRAGKVTTNGYDGTTSHLTTITDANNHTAVTMTYDAQGRVQTQKDARGLTTGQATTYGYVTNGDGTKTTTVTYPTTSFQTSWNPTVADTYDTLGRLITRVSKPNSSETYTESIGYDASSNRNSITDGRGNTTLLCWDIDYSGMTIASSHGNLTRRISPPPQSGQNPLVRDG